jgi:D-alanyl-D-alanine carboxypeptidase/D-alanyl-D-alanine-endopeptidase (penicillin-binding protein 4)
MKLAALFLIAAASTAATAPLAKRINALIEASPATRTAFWGIEAHDLNSKKPLVLRNQGHFFVPASNTKLFTTALALSRLGAGFRVETVVTAAALPDAQGQITGPLTLVGAGDPNLSGRPIPYDVAAEKLDPLTAIRDLAQQLFAKGVRSVAGDVVGDDSRFVHEPYGPGWGVDDPATSDGTPVSALAVNDNTISLLIEPTRLTFTPELAPFTIENRIVPGLSKEIHVSRDAGSTTLRLWGTMPATDKGQTESLGVDDPARYAALALIAALQNQGITVTGTAVAKHRYPGEPFVSQQPSVTLASRQSHILLDNLRVTDKVSQNLHAEMLLRLVGQGSRSDGLKALTEFVSQAGIDPEEYAFYDGSGMSRLNVVTPHAIVQLLTYMAQSPQAAEFASLLPIAGVDGSLRFRFANSVAKGKVFAKTGSLSHTAALSGYAVRKNGHRVVFSIMVNNYKGPAAPIRETVDRICALLVE